MIAITMRRDCVWCSHSFTARVSSTRNFRTLLKAAGWSYLAKKRGWRCPYDSPTPKATKRLLEKAK